MAYLHVRFRNAILKLNFYTPCPENASESCVFEVLYENVLQNRTRKRTFKN